MRLHIVLLCAAWAAACSVQAAEDQCGDLSNGYGPYDYRSDKHLLGVVEVNHFDPPVENLIRGKNASLGGDIDYTLRAFPNHHRALAAMERLANKVKSDPPPHAKYSVSCYYYRAVRFRPDDGTVRMLYANFLAKKNQGAQAIQHMQEAEKLLGENANLHYNMGLVYTDLKEFDKALEHAHRAYALGFPLPGLRNKLQQAGKWREPQVVQAASAQQPDAAGQKAEGPGADTTSAGSPAASGESAVKP